MAVRPTNIQNQRKNILWDEQDDAALEVLVKRKIKDTTIAMREAPNPTERSRLKAQKRHYKQMLIKIQRGSYNGDIIFHELRASAALAQEQQLSHGLHSSMYGGKKYNSQYNMMDFDYEAAFRKKRYYGVALPLVMLILTLVLIASFLMGILSPALFEIPDNVNSTLSNIGLNFNSLIVYRLGETEDGGINDIAIRADDNGYWWWPLGNYTEDAPRPKNGEAWTDINGVTHDAEGETVNLFQDMGVTEIYIDAADIIRGWFKTKMLKNTRLDFLEDLSIFKGTSFYYQIFLADGKSDALVIKKTESGNYDFGVVFNHIGVYGIIMFLLAFIILSVFLFIFNVVRLFTYTSRRFHVFEFFTFLFSLLFLLAPVFATVVGTEFSSISQSFQNYFGSLISTDDFIANTTATVGVSILTLLPAGISFLLLLMPLFFKNRFRTIPKRIPKGNIKTKSIH